MYTLSNEISGNKVVVFDRMSNGSLKPGKSFSTGGAGTGEALGSQGALALSDSGHWLLAVNSGSDNISVFYRVGDFLLRTDKQPSGGRRPISVAIENDLVYVLNADSDNLQGFRLSIGGRLNPIADSLRPLSGTGTDPAQVGFNREGDLLAVTEKATNNVLTFSVDGTGRLGAVHVQASPAPTPFGFAFGRRDQLLISEAVGGAEGASSLSSYQLSAGGTATIVTASLPDQQTAACWVAVTHDGDYAYVSNTGSDNLSAYFVHDDGALSLSKEIAAKTGAGSAPADLAMDRTHNFLYSLNPGTSKISAFQVFADGSLQLIEHQSIGFPASAVAGLVAR